MYVTCVTLVYIYFIIHICVFQCITPWVHLLKARNNLWSTSKWVFIFLICCLQASIIHPCLSIPSRKVDNSIFSLQHKTHIPTERMCFEKKHLSLWKLVYNCMNEWHSLTLKRYNMRKIRYPRRYFNVYWSHSEMTGTLTLTYLTWW